MNQPPPDWQLPPGVSRPLWDYLHSPEVARGYDAYLGESSLQALDLAFVAHHLHPPGRLLDLGCGTGRLLLAAAHAGHQPVGVDLSPAMLAVAREKGRLAGRALNLLQANLTHLSCLAPASFDHAACLFSTLGMIAGEEWRRRALAEVHRLLRPGGRFVLHVHNWWFNAFDREGRRWMLGDLWRRSGDRPAPAHQGLARLTLHHFTRREAVRLLRGAGFDLREVRPVSTRPDGRLRWPWLLSGLRAYGYLIAAVRP